MYFEEALALENIRRCLWWESTISAPDTTEGNYLVSNDMNSFNKLKRGVQIQEQPWLHAKGGKLRVLRTFGNQSCHIPLHRALYQTILPIAEHHKTCDSLLNQRHSDQISVCVSNGAQLKDFSDVSASCCMTEGALLKYLTNIDIYLLFESF